MLPSASVVKDIVDGELAAGRVVFDVTAFRLSCLRSSAGPSQRPGQPGIVGPAVAWDPIVQALGELHFAVVVRTGVTPGSAPEAARSRVAAQPGPRHPSSCAYPRPPGCDRLGSCPSRRRTVLGAPDGTRKSFARRRARLIRTMLEARNPARGASRCLSRLPLLPGGGGDGTQRRSRRKPRCRGWLCCRCWPSPARSPRCWRPAPAGKGTTGTSCTFWSAAGILPGATRTSPRSSRWSPGSPPPWRPARWWCCGCRLRWPRARWCC